MPKCRMGSVGFEKGAAAFTKRSRSPNSSKTAESLVRMEVRSRGPADWIVPATLQWEKPETGPLDASTARRSNRPESQLRPLFIRHRMEFLRTTGVVCHGSGRGFESRRPRHFHQRSDCPHPALMQFFLTIAFLRRVIDCGALCLNRFGRSLSNA